MNKFLSITFFCVFFILSCSSNTARHDPIYLAKDTILRQYIAQADSFSYSDTIDANYRFLRAYLYNDTSFLSNTLNDLKYSIWAIPKELQFDSCAPVTELNASGSDEAYRFIFEESYNFYKTNITVSRSKASAKMHFLIYRPKISEEPCQLIKEYDKQLTSEEWDTIMKSLRYADFWGLRGENGQTGIDGTNLYIDGFRKGQDGNRGRLHRIYRWSPKESSIWDAYKYVYRLSGFTQFTVE